MEITLALICYLLIVVSGTTDNIGSSSVCETLEIMFTETPGSFEYPARSCSNIPQGRPSDYYIFQIDSTSPPVWVYCDMNRTSCSCNTTGGWMRVANLDMTDPNQKCPDGFRLVTRTEPPLRTCGSPASVRPGCVSTTYQTYGVEYSHVCGRIIGYQFGAPDDFGHGMRSNQDIDGYYVDGVSLTHGQSPRQHIWTFAGAINCKCNPREDAPSFVGSDYFCETPITTGDYIGQIILHKDNPVWDGEQCVDGTTCCEFNNPPLDTPWHFCKRLPQPTTDDIELRICGNQGIDDEDSNLETVELYVH